MLHLVALFPNGPLLAGRGGVVHEQELAYVLWNLHGCSNTEVVVPASRGGASEPLEKFAAHLRDSWIWGLWANLA